jgi:hypothetical protein
MCQVIVDTEEGVSLPSGSEAVPGFDETLSEPVEQ